MGVLVLVTLGFLLYRFGKNRAAGTLQHDPRTSKPEMSGEPRPMGELSAEQAPVELGGGCAFADPDATDDGITRREETTHAHE